MRNNQIYEQSIRNQYVKIDLLNIDDTTGQFATREEITGNVLSGSISISATSDIRRTCDITLVVTDSSFDIEPGAKIYLDKYIKVQCGIYNFTTQNIEWENYGIFAINSPKWDYDVTTNTISFQGVDLMSMLTGMRNGYLPGLPVTIPQGSSVKDAIASILNTFTPFKKNIISDCINVDGSIQEVPYDITIDQGGTVYDILDELRNILPNYEIFFDVNGVFRYQKIPTGSNEQIVLDDKLLSHNLVSENVTTDFSEIKNVIIIYGATKDVQHFSTETTLVKMGASNYITVKFPSITSLQENTLYGFDFKDTAAGYCYITVLGKDDSEIGQYVLVDENYQQTMLSDLPYTDVGESHPYVFKYESGHPEELISLGNLQAYAISEDKNPDSPFNVKSSIGKITQVLYGGEYDNIMSDSLAQQRADYELWKSTRLNDSIQLTCIPIHFLDVNQVIEHKPVGKDISNKYIIKSLKVDLSESGTQTIDAITYYPLYPNI